MNAPDRPHRPIPSREQIIAVMPGSAVLLGVLLLGAWFAFQLGSLIRGGEWGGVFNFPLMAAEVLILIFASCGFFTLQPNEARVLVLFGSYKGTVRKSGFHWTNPFTSKIPVSLRSRNLNSMANVSK
jgi:regulator of protease activity HflC (stomatin/prohibitin superfamily)